MAGYHTLLMSWIYFKLPFWAPEVTIPYMFSLATSFEFVLFHLHRNSKKVNTNMFLYRWQFTWMPYRDARILSRVPAEFLRALHGDFFTAVVPLILFRCIEIVNIDRFGGKQGPLNPPLNIDTFHCQSARNDDGWWPVRLQTWFEVWAN
ncbi:hypothetical protein Ahy_Scaffold6g108060 [Arachis hypogaea]|uniref:Aminotransferase-like plant mobile domain-containing protein n=1 Tax=Arachis hypogaea TaxID=3818 RepID=A0A444WP84_ARAHY|nr:hypothetical protein Ahy_Scaffold6g108060 [Arachis hypogaea]